MMKGWAVKNCSGDHAKNTSIRFTENTNDNNVDKNHDSNDVSIMYLFNLFPSILSTLALRVVIL